MPLKLNGEVVRLAQALVEDVREDIMDLESLTQPEHRITELDQTDPAGRFRHTVTGDAWLFQRKKAVSPEEWETFITIASGGVTLDLGEDLEKNLLFLYLEVKQLADMLALVVPGMPG